MLKSVNSVILRWSPATPSSTLAITNSKPGSLMYTPSGTAPGKWWRGSRPDCRIKPKHLAQPPGWVDPNRSENVFRLPDGVRFEFIPTVEKGRRYGFVSAGTLRGALSALPVVPGVGVSPETFLAALPVVPLRSGGLRLSSHCKLPRPTARIQRQRPESCMRRKKDNI